MRDMKKQTLESKKVCRYCHIEKPLSQFEVEKRNTDGHTGRCKECRCAFRENGEYLRERIRKYEVKSGRTARFTDEGLRRMLGATHCAYTGVELNRKPGDKHEATLDHVYPSRGIDGVNIDANVVAVSRSANSAKGQMHVYDFYQSCDEFTDERWYAFVTNFVSRILNREPTPAEIEAWKQGFADEANELRRE